MNWFNEHGDKLLAGIAATAGALQSTGTFNVGTAGAIAGIAAILHTLFWPNNAPKL